MPDRLPLFALPPGTSGMRWQERINNYRRVLADEPYIAETNVSRLDMEPDLAIVGRRVFGMWLLGQSWQVKSGYYGGSPGNFLKRIAALFPDKRRALHRFAGKVDLLQLPGDTLDIRPEQEPTYCTNAETMEGVPSDQYDLVVADPTYSAEDAEHYGTPMVNRDKVMCALERAQAERNTIGLPPRPRAQGHRGP